MLPPSFRTSLTHHRRLWAKRRNCAMRFSSSGTTTAEATRIMGEFLREHHENRAGSDVTFACSDRMKRPSNRLTPLFEVTDRTSTAEILKTDEHESPEGRVMEVFSEHLCQGWLEGYLLTGRHGLFSCYSKRSFISSIPCSTSMRNGLR